MPRRAQSRNRPAHASLDSRQPGRLPSRQRQPQPVQRHGDVLPQRPPRARKGFPESEAPRQRRLLFRVGRPSRGNLHHQQTRSGVRRRSVAGWPLAYATTTRPHHRPYGQNAPDIERYPAPKTRQSTTLRRTPKNRPNHLEPGAWGEAHTPGPGGRLSGQNDKGAEARYTGTPPPAPQADPVPPKT